ncbi:MAG: glutamine synthetase III, partial [Muribaculaceae bacterium]|nr:glutamine synthetase III [Muribaculaceae bacterium]
MTLLRFQAVKEASDRKAVAVEMPSERPEKYYAEAVFNREKMFEYLPKKTFDQLVNAIDNKQPISRELADSVAAGMKKWAIDNGARHYMSLIHI